MVLFGQLRPMELIDGRYQHRVVIAYPLSIDIRQNVLKQISITNETTISLLSGVVWWGEIAKREAIASIFL